MKNLTINVVSTELQFKGLGDAWQKLASQDEHSTLFNDWHWNSLWWEYNSHLGDLNVLLVLCDEKLMGIAPFYRSRSRALGLGKIDTLRFIGNGSGSSPDDLNIVAHSSMRDEVVECVCEHLFSQKFGRMLLADVPVESRFYKSFMSRALSTPGYALKPVVKTRRRSELPADWSGFRQQISRNTHKRVKRRQNKLEATGNYRFNVCSTQEQVGVAFDALVRLHVSRWQSKGHSGSFGDEEYCAFHRKLMEELLGRNQLWLITLEVNDEIVAVEYTFVYNQTLMFYQTGFNLAYKDLSPGHVLMTFAIKTAIESGVKRIDLLKGDYEYKNSYANQKLAAADIGFYSKGLYSFLARLNQCRQGIKRWCLDCLAGDGQLKV